jgi:3-hydroxybutyryl-CoA dehydratase
MLPKVGDRASLARTITVDDIEKFAGAVGDMNPIHFDPAFAKRTRFQRPIAHGMLCASLISAVLGTRLPGPGTVYLHQTLDFKAPAYPGDEVTATVTVTKVRNDRPILTLETVCTNQQGKVLIQGEAVVLLETAD